MMQPEKQVFSLKFVKINENKRETERKVVKNAFFLWFN